MPNSKLYPKDLIADVVFSPDLLPFSDLDGKIVVVIDILRASSTITTALANGAVSIHPVLTPEDAFRVAAEDPEVLCCGERKGLKVKGFDLLIKSWINIKTPLLIVGSGKEKESLVALIKELNLSNKISITNWVEQEELFKLYARSNVLIISSKSEGGPRVALEALANNLPVLSTDVGHMNLILPQEILAEPDNLESLQSLMESYVDNISNLNQESIFEFVKQEFSLEKQADKVMKVYLSVLNKDS